MKYFGKEVRSEEVLFLYIEAHRSVISLDDRSIMDDLAVLDIG